MSSDQELLIRINGSAKNFTDEIDKAKAKTKDLEKSLTTVAKVSTAAFVGLAAAVGGAVARFSSFEKGFTNVVTLLDKSSFKTKTLEQGINSLKEEIISLSTRSGESLDILNQGLFDLVSNGVSAETAISTLEAATQLATAGATDTATAVKALTASITSFGSEAGTAEEIAQKFFTAQKFGSTTVGELASEFNKVAGLAKSVGIGFDETLASLSSLTANGTTPTTVAATQLKAALNAIILSQSKLKNESKSVQDALDLNNIKSRGLVKSFELLNIATGGNVSKIQSLVGSAEALQVVLSLTGQQSDLVKKQITELGDAEQRAATFTDALATKQATNEFAMKQLKVSVDAAAVAFGDLFSPAVTAAAKALAAISEKLATMNKTTLTVIAGVTAFITTVTGLISALSLGTLAFLKIKTGLTAFNKATAIGETITKAYNATLAFGTRALSLFRSGMIAATTTVRGFAAATGIGLVLVALSYMISDLNRTKAVASGVFASIGAALDAFSSNFYKSTDGIAEILEGIFTFDLEKIKSGFDKAVQGAKEGASSVGTAAAEAYNEAYNKSLEQSKAADKANGGDVDQSSLDKLLEAEKLKADAELKIQAEKDAAFLEQKKKQAEEEIALKEQEEARKAAIEEQKKAEALERERRHGENLSVVKQELQALDDEQRALIDEKDLEQFQNVALTKDNIRRELALKELNERVQARKKYLEDEAKHGKAVADLNAFFASENVQLANETGNKLVALTQSKNEALKGIGKAASLTQIGIKTAEGAISAYSSLAGIPVVGPALGIAAAAALVAYGGEQAGAVLRAQRGGIVPEGIGGSNDRIPALLQPGEVVVPRDLAPDFIQSVGRGGGGSSSGGNGGMEVIVGFRDNAFEIIEEKLIERRRIEGRGLGALG